MTILTFEKKSRLKMIWRRLRRPGAIILVLTTAALVIFYIVGAVLGRATLNSKEPVYGATFSRQYAEFLGLDWRAAYLASLDDLGLGHLRLPAYWEEIEPSPDQYDFADLDWQVAEASRRGIEVIISLGIKQPRWPECHLPAWVSGRSAEEIQRRALTMIAAVVRRYRGEKAVSVWQVENEPLLPFGVCPKPDLEFLRSEVAEVRNLDRRPVLIQDAGEFSTWYKTARYADILGVSLYRAVWYKGLVFVRWPGIVAAYRLRAALAAWYVDSVINTELQAEPWEMQGITSVSIPDQLAQMNPETLKGNAAFARRIGFPEIYFWGVEWWYWLKTNGHPELWETGREIIGGPRPSAAGAAKPPVGMMSGKSVAPPSVALDGTVAASLSVGDARSPDPAPSPIDGQLFPPLPDAAKRITKKPFGLKVSPEDSPVSPERFSGYHTGVDLETFSAEQEADVPVYAACPGKLVLKRTASGYGGVAAQTCRLEGRDVVVVYGHLKLTSIAWRVGDSLAAGQQLGLLGRGFSPETDGERKHLHFSIHLGTTADIRGYVQSRSELAQWLDPAALLAVGGSGSAAGQ